ncbi:MAG: PH domain-containing protein [Candidatus Hodarchaeota archaeon]
MYIEEIVKGEPFYPLTALRNKFFLYVITAFVGITVAIFGLGFFIAFMSGFDSDPSGDDFGLWISAYWLDLVFIYLLIWLCIIPILFALIDYYVRTMEFAILDNEVILKKGVLNKEVKHIPFRTITNVSSRYGIYDGFFRLGTCEIETAGKSGQQMGPEGKIEGIKNFIEVRDLILEMLRQFRGQYATTTELEPPPPLPTTGVGFHREMLNELREIKRILSN